MDELEKVEEDIVRLYDTYVVNSRCLFFLEQKLEEFEEVEKMKIEVSVMRGISINKFVISGTKRRDQIDVGTDESG